MYVECLARGGHGGDIEQISRHTSLYAVSLHLRYPLTVKLSPLSCLLIFVILTGTSCLPHGGTLETLSGSGREIIFKRQACTLPYTKSICFLI